MLEWTCFDMSDHSVTVHVHTYTTCRLFKAKDQDLESSLPEVSISGKCNVIRMRGLPFSACIGDILDFFKNVPALDTENIYFVYDSSGRPSGEAYISFLSSDACAAAMKLHKNKMGSRYIELFPSSSVDLQRAAKQRKLRLAKIDGTSAKAQLSAKHADSKAIKLQCQGGCNWKPILVAVASCVLGRCTLMARFSQLISGSPDAGEPTAKQQSSEKPAQAAPASAVSPSTMTPVPTAPPLRRTFAVRPFKICTDITVACGLCCNHLTCNWQHCRVLILDSCSLTWSSHSMPH